MKLLGMLAVLLLFSLAYEEVEAVTRSKIIAQRKAICTLPFARGNCQQLVKKWYYSYLHDDCLMFFYSSCGGNANRFSDREVCHGFCMNPLFRFD